MVPNRGILIGVGVFVLTTFILIFATIYSKPSYTPKTNDGQKWRVGYYEGGSYKDYQTYLLALVHGLEQLKWLPQVDWPQFKANDNTKVVWDELTKVESKYIEFVPAAYWSADWYEDKREKDKAAAIEYLQAGGLDLIIAGGTWAGLDLVNNMHSTPVVVISASDPIKGGIIESAKDPGYDHVHAACDPDRYLRQIRAFHNIVGFKKLGVVYEDTEDGRVYAALEDVTQISVEKDFDVVTCIAFDQNLPEEEAMQGVLHCHKELATQVDAVYITAHRGVNPKWMPAVLEPLFKHRVPTFAQEGPDQVKRGVVLSIARVEVEEMGLFQAKVVGYAFNGNRLSSIDQVFEEQKRIVANAKAAELIGFKIPQSVMDAAYRVYDKIESD
jgi:ABC-type uncharacterized transport system substrate-binding protein